MGYLGLFFSPIHVETYNWLDSNGPNLVRPLSLREICTSLIAKGQCIMKNKSLKLGHYLGVSNNRGTPKWMVCNGKPYGNGWLGGTTIFGNIHLATNCITWTPLSAMNIRFGRPKNNPKIGGWKPTHLTKYSSKWVHLPEVGLQMKIIRNHHPVVYHAVSPT